MIFKTALLITSLLSQSLSEIESFSGGLLTQNAAVMNQTAKMPLGQGEHPLLLNQLEMKYDAKRGIYTPSVVVDPEQMQSLLQFKEKKFVADQNASDFLDAKWKYYRSLPYNYDLLSYIHPYPRLNDWMELNHPPLRQLSNGLEFYSKTAAKPAKHESRRETVEFQSEIDELSGNELTTGNTVHFINNKDVTTSRLEVVKKAKKTLWGSSLLFVCDPGTQPLIDLLAEKVKQGVDVRIMLDFFMQKMQKGNCIETLRAQGINVALVKGMILHRSAFHIKMWVADLSTAQVEGMNMIDVETLSTGFNHLYSDSGLSLEGPIVTDLYSKYIELWNQYAPSEIPEELSIQVVKQQQAEKAINLRGTKNYSSWLKTRSPTCRLITQDRKSVIDRVSSVYEKYLDSATDQIITTSVRRGFNGVDHGSHWNNRLLTLLKDKAITDHVHVDLMVNANQNTFSAYSIPSSGMDAAARRNPVTTLMQIQRTMSANLSVKSGAKYFDAIATETDEFRAWSYMDFSHLKISLVDRDTVITGSYNPYTSRSDRDAELVVICSDPTLATEVNQQLTLDLGNSTPFPFRSQFSGATP